MAEEVKPALTPEEWAEVEGRPGVHHDVLYYALGEVRELMPDETEGERRHALAALALHCQPFGFADEDVAKLRQLDAARKGQSHLSDFFEGVTWNEEFTECHEHGAENVAWLHGLIARIAALLPPEAP